MKVLIFVKNEELKREELRAITERLEESSVPVEIIDPDTREGSCVAEIYDVFSTPSLFVTSDNGSVFQSWLGLYPSPSDVINAAAI